MMCCNCGNTLKLIFQDIQNILKISRGKYYDDILNRIIETIDERIKQQYNQDKADEESSMGGK